MTESTAIVPSLAGARWLTEGAVAHLLGVLDTDGEEARVVGGAVRNALLGLPHGDVDIATTALPAEVMRRAAAAGLKPVPTGIEHGTVTIVVDGVGIEVTTLRRDIETDGRRAVVRFGRDWEADARRRDFTINAFSADRRGHVHDPIGGFDDLARRRVRFIGDPTTRIREDYLRILRFFRFQAIYGAGSPDVAGLGACLAERAGLARLSRERVRLEILKLLTAAGAAPTLVVMEEVGLIQLVLGSVVHHGAFARLVALEAAHGFAPDAMRRLAALAVLVDEDAQRLHERLRLTNEEHRRLVVIAGHQRPMAAADVPAAKVLLYRLGVDDYREVVLTAWARSGAAVDDDPWLDRLEQPVRWPAPRFPLKAANFIARGMTPGPALGQTLAAAEAAWIAAGFPNEATELAHIVDTVLRRRP